MTVLLLSHRVGVIPISSCLPYFEMIGERFTRFDAWVSVKARNTIHLTGQQQIMSVNGSILIHIICHMNSNIFAFGEVKRGAGDCTVYSDFFDGVACYVHRFASDQEFIFFRLHLYAKPE